MALEHEHHAEHGHHGPQALPSVLAAPDFVAAWRMRALVIGAVFALISVVFAFDENGRAHLLRSYLMGSMTAFNFVGGALAFLLVQYLSGGKWGLILRRPLEAMTRTWWFVGILFLPVLFLMKKLYLWATYNTPEETLSALNQGLISKEQQICINLKHTMLSPVSAVVEFVLFFGFLGLIITLLNKWSLGREADPAAGSMASYDRWRILFENLSGPSILLYVIGLTDFVIVFLKSLDVTWYSSIYGLQLLVAQGYAVLALGMLTLILLSRYEPMRTMFRTTEQHDLGKLAFAFTMLNIYFTFAEFLIIYSGNLPDEIPWYLHRIRGGWWVICSLDAICHWIIPFCLLLSRDFKRSKTRMVWLCVFMIFARLIDMFWLVEPNFKDAAGNLHIAGNISILAYITVPIAILSFWAAFYLTELGRRPLIVVNDPHTAEVLEPEHAH
ncbi:MAG TPA: hypothetical protein VKV02_01145 [Acidobacteriaceae bacterium]|nr:hypothetical protein [Acidobacteriaceae bacterium]